MESNMKEILLEVKNLTVNLDLENGPVKVIENLSFTVAPKETLGIVGESGCGKSMTSLAIMGLLPQRVANMTSDSSIQFEGIELTSLKNDALQNLRGSHISLILQDSMTSLNPVTSIEKQMIETIQAHKKISRAEALAQSIDMLRKVGIPAPELRIKDYPHQMSGGMKQRICIAIALLCGPKLLIADEPTTALDVTIQAQILELLKEQKELLGTAVVLITHDLGVISDMVDNVLVMYAGRVVEYSKGDKLFEKPLHPYTQGLLACLPRTEGEDRDLLVIPGQVPLPGQNSEGCKFHPRCAFSVDFCRKAEPPLIDEDGRQVRCWLYKKTESGE
jgi:peptide/nickel transport system ATP-binding protein/oligopeptide transport system ATP-binding protein